MEGIIKCKNCGADIDLSKAINGIVECDFCFSKFTLPKKDLSPAALSFLRQGEHNLDTCKFDDAYTAFSKAAEYDDREPEAYWGMALAEFKVQYIKDTVNNRLQPICHEFTDKQFAANKNYLFALKFATQKQKEEYEKKAQEIDYIRSKFLELKESGLDYDCFICVKVSRINSDQLDNSKKNWTEDAYDADAIYDLLKRNGYTPFFSEREIKGRTGTDYEAMILYALYTSETMLVVCRNEEHLQTPWVKNEFIRFKELINNKDKENDALTIIYNDTPIEKLPGSKGKIQGIDYSRREADFEIIKFVDEHTPLARAKREEEKRKQELEAEKIRCQIEEQKKAQQQLEERLEKINSYSATDTSPTVDTLLTRANQEMETEDLGQAEVFFEKVLDCAPENAAAWWGLFLCDFNCNSVDSLLLTINNKNIANTITEILLNNNFKRSVQYAKGNLKEQIKNFIIKLKAVLVKLKDTKNLQITTITKQIDNLQNEYQQNKDKISNKRLDKAKRKRALSGGLALFLSVVIAISCMVLFLLLTNVSEPVKIIVSIVILLIGGSILHGIFCVILQSKCDKEIKYIIDTNKLINEIIDNIGPLETKSKNEQKQYNYFFKTINALDEILNENFDCTYNREIKELNDSLQKIYEEEEKEKKGYASYSLLLKSFGTAKIDVIKFVSDKITYGNLKEAKDLVLAAPTIITKCHSLNNAKKLKESLVEIGAEVEIVRDRTEQ